jgi:hypothetical protein
MKEKKAPPKEKPFQRLQFLVRDYQNFDCEFDDDDFYTKSAEEKVRLSMARRHLF